MREYQDPLPGGSGGSREERLAAPGQVSGRTSRRGCADEGGRLFVTGWGLPCPAPGALLSAQLPTGQPGRQ